MHMFPAAFFSCFARHPFSIAFFSCFAGHRFLVKHRTLERLQLCVLFPISMFLRTIPTGSGRCFSRHFVFAENRPLEPLQLCVLFSNFDVLRIAVRKNSSVDFFTHRFNAFWLSIFPCLNSGPFSVNVERRTVPCSRTDPRSKSIPLFNRNANPSPCSTGTQNRSPRSRLRGTQNRPPVSLFNCSAFTRQNVRSPGAQ